MKTAKEIREFVTANLLYGDGAALTDETSFLDSGIVDSTGILEIITFLEQNFEIEIQPEEMIPENMDSVSRIAAFIERKRQSPATDAVSPPSRKVGAIN